MRTYYRAQEICLIFFGVWLGAVLFHIARYYCDGVSFYWSLVSGFLLGFRFIPFVMAYCWVALLRANPDSLSPNISRDISYPDPGIKLFFSIYPSSQMRG
jgi:hypothetical protein